MIGVVLSREKKKKKRSTNIIRDYTLQRPVQLKRQIFPQYQKTGKSLKQTTKQLFLMFCFCQAMVD